MLSAPKTFSVAPMMDWTTRHCRVVHRQLSSRALLYSEMITSAAICLGDAKRLLYKTEAEGAVCLQLGGCDPQQLAQAVTIAEDFDYHSYNLNIGCPSDRVQRGKIGAVLMREPDLVADCVAAMQAKTDKPVTVKCRLGVDEQDENWVMTFIERVKSSGCTHFIVHARKAWLQGLDPKANRDVPPLNYSLVYQLKQQFPELNIVINGGITQLSECAEHLQHVDGVMLGRAAYHHPWLLNFVDAMLANNAGLEPTDTASLAGKHNSRRALFDAITDYVADELRAGVPVQHVVQSWLGLFHGMAGGRYCRRFLSEELRDLQKSRQTEALISKLNQFMTNTDFF